MPSLLSSFSQGNRQGMDMGTEYRSIILCEDKGQLDVAVASKEAKQVIKSNNASSTSVELFTPETSLVPPVHGTPGIESPTENCRVCFSAFSSTAFFQP